MIASDIMRTHVITVREDQTLRELAQVLQDNRITGAPVVDDRGRLVGVVSQTDLVRRQREASSTDVPAYHREEAWLDANGFSIETPDYGRVRDIMTPAVLSADEKTPVEELARCMSRKGVHRLVITRRGKLAGIVTSMDLMKHFEAAGGA